MEENKKKEENKRKGLIFFFIILFVVVIISVVILNQKSPRTERMDTFFGEVEGISSPAYIGLSNPLNCTGTALPPQPWKESYDPQSIQDYCLDGSVLFIAQDIRYAFRVNGSEPYKLIGSASYVDLYMNNINYNSPQKLNVNNTPVTFEFNYSIPHWDVPEIYRPYLNSNETYCPIGDLRYGIYISNDNMDDFSDTSFYTGGKDLFRTGECDTWYTEVLNIPDLKVYSINFSLSSKRIGAGALETPNVKIDLNSMRFCKNEVCNSVY